MTRSRVPLSLLASLATLVVGGCAGSGSSQPLDGDPLLDTAASRSESDGAVGPSGDTAPGPTGSPGCGLTPEVTPGGSQLTHTFSDAAGGERSFYLSVSEGYDPERPARLYFGYAGTNWLGAQIQPYLGLEGQPTHEGEIYVYPDVQWHDFPGWGNLGGWLLGPHATPADGMEDLEFTRELFTFIAERYCVDPDRVFATGHSWGGDMAAVVGCFLGDIFRAVAPAAANRPYWFEPAVGGMACEPSAAVWTFFGQADDHFTTQAYPGQFGDEQVAFWRAEHGCGEEATSLSGMNQECERYEGCAQDTRYCLYSAEAGHGVPSYFSSAILSWFREF